MNTARYLVVTVVANDHVAGLQLVCGDCREQDDASRTTYLRVRTDHHGVVGLSTLIGWAEKHERAAHPA